MRWLPIRYPPLVAALDAGVVIARAGRIVSVLVVAGGKGLLALLAAQGGERRSAFDGSLGEQRAGYGLRVLPRMCRRLDVGLGGCQAQAQRAGDAANDQKMFHRNPSSGALPSLIATFDAVLPETDANGAIAVLVVALFVVGVATLEARRPPVGNDPARHRAGILQGRRRCCGHRSGLYREQAKTGEAREAASQQQKALHRDCPHISGTKASTIAKRRQGDLMPLNCPDKAAAQNGNLATSPLVFSVIQPSEDSMTKTILIALACAAGAVSMAQAQSSGSAGGSAGGSVGGSTGGSTSGGVGNMGAHGTSSGTGSSVGAGGGAVVTTPPGSAGAGTSSGATVNQPAIDTNQAQQPGIGANTGASGGAGVPRR